MKNASVGSLPNLSIPYGDGSSWGSAFDVITLASRVNLCKQSYANTRLKGEALENLLIWLLGHVQGVTVRKRDVFSANRSQEIDLLCWNEQAATGFNFMGNRFLAECKNWDAKVDSSDVAWFAWKMRLAGVTDGVLLAANGITGHSSRRSAANEILVQSNSEQPPRKIYTLQLDELSQLTSVASFRDLIIDRSLGLSSQNPFA